MGGMDGSTARHVPYAHPYPSAENSKTHLEHIKRSTQGKLASATQRQSAEYLKPFFKMLRQRVSSIVCDQISPLTTPLVNAR